MSRLKVGDTAPPLKVETLRGERLEVPSPETRWVHLQFRRFAGCPICNLHLRGVARRIGELEAAGVREVAVLHSTAEAMRPYQGDLPFAVVADPDKQHYRAFGVETSLLGTLDPRNLKAVFIGMASSHPKHLTEGDEGGHLGMPADFLLDAGGRVVACKYGAFADDQWSVDEVLALAGRHAS
jgi:peroxiredoxin